MAASLSALYSPLQATKSEIRLLSITQSTEQAGHICSLTVASLLDRPRFTALSYVWGDASITEHVSLNGLTISVTKNLAGALRHVKRHWVEIQPDRDANEFRLWADAICINQDDLQERGEQVRMMGCIYAASETTFAWLGDEDNEIPRALSTIESLWERKILQHEDTADASDITWVKQLPCLCADDFPDDDASPNGHSPMSLNASKTWSAIASLLKLPYWTRVWILQELVISQRLYFLCPSKTTQGQKLLEVAEVMGELQWPQQRIAQVRPEFLSRTSWAALRTTSLPWGTLVNIKSTRAIYHHPHGPFRASEASQGNFAITYRFAAFAASLKSSDPRDAIYGLLALTRLPILPQYDSSKSAGAAAVDFVEAWLQLYPEMIEDTEFPPLSLLVHAGTSISQQPSAFSSWAPNFAQVSSASPFLIGDGQSPQAIFGPRFTKPRVSGASLLVQAVILQTARYVVPLTPGNIGKDLFQYLIDFLSRTSVYASGIQPLQAFARVFQRNSSPSLEPADLDFAFTFVLLLAQSRDASDEKESLEKGMAQSTALLPGTNTGHTFSDWFIDNFWRNTEGMPTGPARRILRYIFKVRENHRLDLTERAVQEASQVFSSLTYFETEEEYLGLVPKICEPGDKIAIAAGSDVPIVLRVQANNQYAHVGTCFVLGLMDGVPRRLLNDGSKPVSTIELP